MQAVSDHFMNLAEGGLRPLNWQLRISFDKTFDDDIDFFTISSDASPMSLLDGIDVLAPSDNNVVQEWDKYDYADYTDRVMQMEWSREEDIPFSVSQAMADVTLNNYDSYFTRGSSPLDPNVLPRRPIRLLSGFKDVAIPQFVGLTETVPQVDKAARTASVHCIDFLSFLFDKPLDQTVMLQNVRTDEALDYLFQLFGLLPSQYVLDEGFNQIKFVYWEKGKKLGEAIKDLMQAEMGSLYMDELGIIRFRNRIKPTTASVMSFDSSNIIDYQLSDETKIINVVEINANVREVQSMQPVYTLSEPIQLLAGQTKDEFFNLDDPITSLGDITLLANSQIDGEGTDLSANVSVDDVDAFATAVKITFTNSGANAYITDLEIQGTPAKAVGDPLYVRFEDTTSVDDFEEQILTIDNDFIQSQDAANSLGLTILNYYKDYANTIELDVKGNPALQLGDNVDVDADEISDTYTITKITNILESPGKYAQRIVGKIFNIPDFFILSSDDTAMSILNGEAVLSP